MMIFLSLIIFAQEQNSDIYDYISKNIMANAHSVIMETTKEEYSTDEIKIAGKIWRNSRSLYWKVIL